MATGSVSVVQVNNMQGSFDEVERLFLYIGRSGNSETLGEIISVSASSDLDELFGEDDSELKTQISAAIVNSRTDNFVCYAIGIDPDDAEDPDDWKDAVYYALEKPNDLNVEAICLCSPVTTNAEVEACYTCATKCLTSYAKFVTVFAAVKGIDPATQSWSDYISELGTLVNGVAADRVCLVPLLHGNNLGVVAGRLCDPAVTVADTPMRVATGALISLGDDPVDVNGSDLDSATISALASARFSVPQWYTGYDGMYWADHCTLDVEAGDFQAYENRRVLDYCARRVRTLAIGRVADRRLNSTAKSIAANKTYFMRPLREASHSVTLAGQEMPGIIKPPEDEDITIEWESNTSVIISIAARPYNCPKKITLYLGLDMS